jgi:hypothetical protein
MHKACQVGSRSRARSGVRACACDEGRRLYVRTCACVRRRYWGKSTSQPACPRARIEVGRVGRGARGHAGMSLQTRAGFCQAGAAQAGVPAEVVRKKRAKTGPCKRVLYTRGSSFRVLVV